MEGRCAGMRKGADTAGEVGGGFAGGRCKDDVEVGRKEASEGCGCVGFPGAGPSTDETKRARKGRLNGVELFGEKVSGRGEGKRWGSEGGKPFHLFDEARLIGPVSVEIVAVSVADDSAVGR